MWQQTFAACHVDVSPSYKGPSLAALHGADLTLSPKPHLMPQWDIQLCDRLPAC